VVVLVRVSEGLRIEEFPELCRCRDFQVAVIKQGLVPYSAEPYWHLIFQDQDQVVYRWELKVIDKIFGDWWKI